MTNKTVNKKSFTKTHEITPLTMAILADHDENGKRSTCILEKESQYIVESSPSKVIDDACHFFGSSLRGRQEGTRHISGITHKAPIAIDPYSGMYFFPTISPASPTCSWIAHTHIYQVNEAVNQQTEITFNTGQKIIVEVSIGSIINQVNRTAQFRYLLGTRINPLKARKYTANQVADPSLRDPFGLV